MEERAEQGEPAQQVQPDGTGGAAAEHWLTQEGAAAGFSPAEGFYCTAVRVRAPRLPGGWFHALREPESRARLHARPAFYGNPLLFPFPMGIAEGRLAYRGREYQLQPSREKRVIHGVVRDRPWQLDRVWTDAEGTHIRSTIATAGNAELLAEYPFPFRFTATQTLRAPGAGSGGGDSQAGQSATLHIEVEAENLHDEAIPIGLGIHPYVPYPMVPAGGGSTASRREDCTVWSDVTHLMETRGEREGELAPVSGVADLRAAPRVVDLIAAQASDVPGGGNGGMMYTYANAPGDTRGVRWEMADRQAGVRVRVETSGDFRSVVLWAPREPTVCVSPVISTVNPNGFNLSARGHDTGTVELAPGATWRTWTRIIAEAF